MPQPLIAIVGSAEADRADYDPPLANLRSITAAAEGLGSELARQGFRLIVYTSDSTLIESHVVRGFARACSKGAEHLIQVRYPFSASKARFAETDQNEKLFEYRTDPDLDWQVSYYRSFRDADGVVLIGGGNTTFVTGHLALSQRKALMPIACFGGAAQRIWQSLRPGQDLLTETEYSQLAASGWRSEQAKELVSGLLAQHQRRLKELDEERDAVKRQSLGLNTRAALAVALFVIALAMAAWGGAFTDPKGSIIAEIGPTWLAKLLLYLIGPIAGAAGAMTRTLWKPAESDAAIITTFGKGFIAGATAALLYLLAQQSTVGNITQISSVSMLFALAVGLLAGFTFDKVFARMADADVRIDVQTANRDATHSSPAGRLEPNKRP